MRNSRQALESQTVFAKLVPWAKRARARTFHIRQLDIGPRLTACFIVIILAMLVGNVVLLWEFHLAQARAERLSGVDRALITVLQVHTDLMSFHERLDGLARSQDAPALLKEVEPLRNALREETQRSRNALERLPPEVQLDPTLLPTLEAIQSALPPQLEAIAALARSRDWEAVRLRLANEIRPLESKTSTLVQDVDREVGEERAQAILSMRTAQMRILLTAPATAVLTLLIASLLGLAIRRSITQPLTRLMEGSKALARGDFHHQVAIQGEDELAHLGRVFNDTANRLAALYETLQNNEARFRLAIDTIPGYVWSALPDGSVDFINRRWLEFSGVSLGEGLGWGWEAAVHPDDAARFMDEWRAAVVSGEAMETEARVRRADGQYRWLLIRNVPLRDEGGKIVKWYGTSTDIDDRKRAEEERERLRQLEAELAHLNRVNIMGELAASIAHEVKQPLAAVATSGSACLHWLAGDAPNVEKAREAAQRIVRDGKRAAEVIDRIRALTKRVATPREKLDLNETIQEVLALVGDEAKRKSVTTRTQFADDLSPVSGDRVQLQQVLLNLVMNAMEAMSSVEERGRELVITTRNIEAGQVQVTVEDSGPGIDPNTIDKIFDPFYTTKPGGMGMGLSISRSIVEAHGGRLWATANHGPGTSFHFALPQHHDEEPNAGV